MNRPLSTHRSASPESSCDWETLLKDNGVMHGQVTTSSIGRAFVMMLGLRGRYGHRLDRGEDFPEGYPWRHQMKSKLESDSEDDGPWEFSYQISVEEATGPIEVPTGPSQAQVTNQYIYMAEHEDEKPSHPESRATGVATTSVTTLFGLTGVLQHRETTPEKPQELFYAPHSKGTPMAHTDMDTTYSDLFWLAHGYIPFSEGGVYTAFDIMHSPALWKTRPLTENEYWHFVEPAETLDRTTSEIVKCMKLVKPTILQLKKLTETPEKPKETQWRAQDTYLNSNKEKLSVNICRSGMHRLAKAILQLPATRSSFLFPSTCSIDKIFPIDRRRERLKALLSERIKSEDTKPAIRDMHQYLQHKVSIFSRERIKLCLDLREEVSEHIVQGPFHDIVCILSLASLKFLEAVLEKFTKCNISTSPGEKAVTITLDDQEPLKFPMNLSQVLPGLDLSTPRKGHDIPVKNVAYSCIHALSTLLMHAVPVSSKPLTKLAESISNEVYITLDTSVPEPIRSPKLGEMTVPSESDWSSDGGASSETAGSGHPLSECSDN